MSLHLGDVELIRRLKYTSSRAIDVADDGTATDAWTLIDYDLNLAEGNKTTAGTAIYKDRYVKRNGRWLIAHSEYDRVFERVYIDPEPGLTVHFLATAHGQ